MKTSGRAYKLPVPSGLGVALTSAQHPTPVLQVSTGVVPSYYQARTLIPSRPLLYPTIGFTTLNPFKYGPTLLRNRQLLAHLRHRTTWLRNRAFTSAVSTSLESVNIIQKAAWKGRLGKIVPRFKSVRVPRSGLGDFFSTRYSHKHMGVVTHRFYDPRPLNALDVYGLSNSSTLAVKAGYRSLTPRFALASSDMNRIAGSSPRLSAATAPFLVGGRDFVKSMRSHWVNRQVADSGPRVAGSFNGGYGFESPTSGLSRLYLARSAKLAGWASRTHLARRLPKFTFSRRAFRAFNRRLIRRFRVDLRQYLALASSLGYRHSRLARPQIKRSVLRRLAQRRHYFRNTRSLRRGFARSARYRRQRLRLAHRTNGNLLAEVKSFPTTTSPATPFSLATADLQSTPLSPLTDNYLSPQLSPSGSTYLRRS